MKKEDRNNFLLFLKWLYFYLFKRFLFYLIKKNFLTLLKKIILTLIGSNKINLDKITLKENINLNEIFVKFATDKGTLRQIPVNKTKFNNYLDWINRDADLSDVKNEEGHNYTPFYEKHLNNIRKKKFNMLEIGVASGHSTASFYFWFPHANFYCVDIKNYYKFFYKGNRIINYSAVDLRNKVKVDKYLRKFNSFDVIIEDAIHNKKGIFTSFKNFFPKLNKNGYYIIEDFMADEIISKNVKDSEEPHSTSEIFQNIKDKKFFKSSILDDGFQKKLFNEIEDVNIYKGQKFDSSICFIKKK